MNCNHTAIDQVTQGQVRVVHGKLRLTMFLLLETYRVSRGKCQISARLGSSEESDRFESQVDLLSSA